MNVGQELLISQLYIVCERKKGIPLRSTLKDPSLLINRSL